MIQDFHDSETEDIYNGRDTKKARRRLPAQLWEAAFDKLDLLDSVATLNELRVPPGNELEKLKGDRAGQHSIRINKQYRICFAWTAAGPSRVEVTDYH